MKIDTKYHTELDHEDLQNKKDEFDIILQDLDNLASLEDDY